MRQGILLLLQVTASQGYVYRVQNTLACVSLAAHIRAASCCVFISPPPPAPQAAAAAANVSFSACHTSYAHFPIPPPSFTHAPPPPHYPPVCCLPSHQRSHATRGPWQYRAPLHLHARHWPRHRCLPSRSISPSESLLNTQQAPMA